MANLTDTTMFKKLNSQTAMYDADNVDFLINGLSATYAGKTSVYTKTEADDKFATKEDISSVYHFKGSVETYQDLKAIPSAELEIGDTYNVDESGKNYAWTGVTSAYDEGWDVLGGTFDLSNYYTKDDTDGLLSAKVDKVEGMGLSHNDFTDAYVEKLDAIPSGAQENVIETIKVDGAELPVTEKTVEITLSGKLDTSGGTMRGSIEFARGSILIDDGNAVGNILKVGELDKTLDGPYAEVNRQGFKAAWNSGSTHQDYDSTTYGNGEIWRDNDKIELPSTSGTIALISDIATETSGKADNTAFAGLTAFQLVDTSAFDVEELAIKYNTLVTVLSGIAATLNP